MTADDVKAFALALSKTLYSVDSDDPPDHEGFAAKVVKHFEAVSQPAPQEQSPTT